MKAVILAAGCSRRLRPHTDFMPKCLLTVAGDPILQRAIQSLLSAQGAKLTELVMVTGYRAEWIASRNIIARAFSRLLGPVGRAWTNVDPFVSGEGK